MQLCAWWHFTAPLSGSGVELRQFVILEKFTPWADLLLLSAHQSRQFLSPSGVLHLQAVGKSKVWVLWHPAMSSMQCLSQLHAQSMLGASSKEPIPPKISYSLHGTQTYCLNKTLCGSLKRGEEDEVLILIMQKCYLALQVPHQHRWLFGKCLQCILHAAEEELASKGHVGMQLTSYIKCQEITWLRLPILPLFAKQFFRHLIEDNLKILQLLHVVPNRKNIL